MLLKEVFRDNDSILMRAGGDEFVIFVKDILNVELVRKNVELMQKIRDLQFGKTGYTITCSAGCCYLQENVSGYTYDQLFENADIALYKAKAAAYRSRHAAAAPLLLNARRENRYRLPEQTAHAHHHTITAFCGFHSDSTSFPC